MKKRSAFLFVLTTALGFLAAAFQTPTLRARKDNELTATAKGKSGEVAADENEEAPPEETRQLLERAKRILSHYFELRLKAILDERPFNSDDAWDAGARRDGYKNRKEFEDAVAARKKADTKHFEKLFDTLYARLYAEHVMKVAEALEKRGS